MLEALYLVHLPRDTLAYKTDKWVPSLLDFVLLSIQVKWNNNLELEETWNRQLIDMIVK